MRVTILSGYSRGLGAAMLEHLLPKLSATHKLICVGRAAVKFTDPNLSLFKCDLSSQVDWSGLLDAVPTKVDELRVILNAGTIEPIVKVGAISPEAFTQSTMINYIQPVLMVNQLVSLLEEPDVSMKVVNISTGAASRPIAGWGAYCATKCAVKMHLEVLKQEYDEQVSVAHLDPGVMDTGMQETIRSKSVEEFPDAAYFAELKESGKLRSPSSVAREIFDEVDEL
ncbi:SDR family NAD(P)-dependent oxidoreductase [Porticoccus sp. W117]|nr:SDR family NAD(P)-dependent oxidoreductase [Porticoccus sp. W117]MDM3872382.1 SDR family NAD(P)-dependent oxidoreductase [Porticoccus sp. W117]